MNNIAVSVIIPVYNAEPYLRQCLNSVVNQTLRDIEIICIDDGSTDGSLGILREYEQQDSRFCVLTQPHSNAGSARNRGLDAACGRYLSFLDADDFFDHELLHSCVAVLEQDESDFVIFSANQYNEETGETEIMVWSLREDYLPERRPFSPLEMKEYLFNSFQNWPWNKMFRKSFIDSYGIRFQNIERTNDMAFVCEAMARAVKISVLPKPFANYRVGTHENSQSTNHLYPRAFWDAYIETKNRLVEANLYETYQQSYLNWILGGILYNIGANRQEYSKVFARAIVKFEGEREFGFLKHDRDYYYEPWLYDEYRTIVEAETPPEIEQLHQDNGLLRAEIDSLRADCDLLRQEKAKIEKEKIQLLSSKSYRLGRLLSFPYRKAKEWLHYQ